MKIHGSLSRIINIKCHNQQKKLAIRQLMINLDYLITQAHFLKAKKYIKDLSVKASSVCREHTQPLSNKCLSSVPCLIEASISTI